MNPLRDVGHDFGELQLSIGTAAIGEHPHRRLVLSNAVDPAGEMVLGAERGLHKSFDDLAVGERLFFNALARCDSGDFRGCRWRRDDAAERDYSQSGREYPPSL